MRLHSGAGIRSGRTNLDGKLDNAPRFTSDSVVGLEASEISLVSIHTHMDKNGFVYINLDAIMRGRRYHGKTNMEIWISRKS